MRASKPATNSATARNSSQIRQTSAELTLLNAGGSIPVMVLNDAPIPDTIKPLLGSTQTALMIDPAMGQTIAAAATTTATANNVR